MANPVIINWPCLKFIDPPSVVSQIQPVKPISAKSPNPKPLSETLADSTKTALVVPPINLDNNITSSDHAKNPPKFTQKSTKSFAQAVSNLCDIPSSQLPQPVLKGNNFAISIPEEEYVAGMESCKYNLHARVIWPKGSTPLTVLALRNKLSLIWKDLRRWGVSSIGKGYFEFIFSSLEDVKRVRSTSSWNLNPGVLKLFTWSRDFNPRNQNTTSTQVWVRIHGLSQEYWRPKIIFAIANGVGTPICTDTASSKPMMDRTFGHFVRVLVDVDLAQELRYKVLVERKDFAFFVEFEYENLPEVCSHCLKIGHHVDVCKLLNRTNDAPGVENRNQEGRKQYNVVHDGRKKQGTLATDPIVVEDAAAALLKVHNNNSVDSQLVERATDANKSLVADVPVQNNRFDILVQKEVAASIQRDADLEAEINNELGKHGAEVNDDDETSSQGTEFVENTQGTPVHEPILQLVANFSGGNLADQNLEAIEKSNREFLEKSWANIAENEEVEQRLLKHLEEDPQDGFQVVRRSRGKSIKKNTSIKSGYLTRNKTGNPLPFK